MASAWRVAWGSRHRNGQNFVLDQNGNGPRGTKFDESVAGGIQAKEHFDDGGEDYQKGKTLVAGKHYNVHT